MSDKDTTVYKKSRIYFLDNLRTFMILLVVTVHSGLVYESSGVGAWFWIVDDYSTNILADYVSSFIDIFVMSIIFFVSGYLTPISLKRKSTAAFIRSKFTRLMLPWIIAVLTLIPLYKFIFLYSRNIPQGHWSTYFHWNNGIFSQNWLWFLPVLFLFDILYLVLSYIKVDVSRLTLKFVVAAVFVTGFVYSTAMDIFHLQGWTKTATLDFQNERILIYFLIFLLGSFCYQKKIFKSPDYDKTLFRFITFSIWIPTLVFIYFYTNFVQNTGTIIISPLADTGVMWFCFHLSLLGMLYLLVRLFRRYFDRQGKAGKILNENSYNVYIIHTVVLGGIATLMLNLAVPSLVKYILLVVLTYITSNVIVSIYQLGIKPKIMFISRRKHQ